MRSSHALAVLAAASALAGCVPSGRGVLRARSHAATDVPRGARARFEPYQFDSVFQGVVRAVRARGFEIAACDPDFGALATVSHELDAPCGASTCLARDVATVKLGYRRARVTVTRQFWDATVRGWRTADDPRDLEPVAGEERAIVEAAIRRPAADGEVRLADGCGSAPPCDGGACLAAAPFDR